MIETYKILNHRVPRPRFSIGWGNFGDSTINKRFIANFSSRMRETAIFLRPVYVQQQTLATALILVLLQPNHVNLLSVLIMLV